ncbi:MAG: HlyD family type I secretion periplasmic adaptor subunit [Gammaproteobacteria bacterium]|nr:HlyD family type I secretion periplasmic adaptor subunit [Gammaproteobacteria bacterium]NIO62197.1 HlyD family type I secretion periplasmic adaptor subunit [Gammaproteobacteria bacterium]NIQ19385.1 HlyD family type I secretion periplasmic adaptor subunit [Gammaproteobacteria bacterium]NIT40856.1 HlyD family type I secretion periplasmic adaptor subunit [Gammaproteobacteria bacterium]
MERIKKAIELAREERQARAQPGPAPDNPANERAIDHGTEARVSPSGADTPESEEALRDDKGEPDQIDTAAGPSASTTGPPDSPDQGSVNVDRADNPWRLIVTGILCVMLLILGVAAWVVIAPLSGAVISPGYVKVDMNRKTVQHQEGGIVGEILVRDGSKVKAGDTLITLKDVRVDASNELVRTQLDAELAQAARLAAEQAGEEEISFPPELTERSDDPRVAELLQRETNVFGIRREALTNQLSLIRRQIKDIDSEVKERLAQLKADKETLRHHQAETDLNKKLIGEGFIPKTRMIELERTGSELVSRGAENRAELASARQKISDLELRAETLRSEFQQEASNKLRETTASIFDLRERLRPAQDAEKRQRITAPISGEIVDLRITSVGAVIAPREPILDIVPENANLLVEVRVRPEDIASVHYDSLADVRLTAFRRRVTPTVEGKVTYVSADRLMDEQTNTPYYTVHVRVPPDNLKKAGDLELQAGMPAEVFIKTTPRNALEYFLDPILGFVQRSMREK